MGLAGVEGRSQSLAKTSSCEWRTPQAPIIEGKGLSSGSAHQLTTRAHRDQLDLFGPPPPEIEGPPSRHDGGPDETITWGQVKSTGGTIRPATGENKHTAPAPAAWFQEVRAARLPIGATSVARILAENAGKPLTVAQIAQETRLALFSVRRSTRRLQAAGFLHVDFSRGHRPNRYTLTVPGGVQ
jgi:hypothetical protein